VLQKFDNENYQIPKIQFSTNSNKLAYFGDFGLMIFDTGNYSILKHYNKLNIGLDISRFTFIGDQYIGIQSTKTSIIRLSDDFKFDLIEFPQRGFLMETNTGNNILLAGTGYPALGGSIIAWDLNKVLSSIGNKIDLHLLNTEFQNGILTITNLSLDTNTAVIQIFDINGKLVKEINLEHINSEIKIPLVLSSGTYLINIKVGKEMYSSKFLVTE
jgi:hypothetical protein